MTRPFGRPTETRAVEIEIDGHQWLVKGQYLPTYAESDDQLADPPEFEPRAVHLLVGSSPVCWPGTSDPIDFLGTFEDVDCVAYIADAALESLERGEP